METLVVVRQRNQNQYYGGTRKLGNGSAKFELFGSPNGGNFGGINCRSFESGAVLLPTPFKSSPAPRTPSPEKPKSSKRTIKTSPVSAPNNIKSENEDGGFHSSELWAATSYTNTPPPSSEKYMKSSPILIPTNNKFEKDNGGFHFSELWAGPAYSNSPPPSSLPLPKFSLRPKRTVSLELPKLGSEIDLRTFAKSAPSSPTRERSPSPGDLFDDSATNTLRRILNLDITDE